MKRMMVWILAGMGLGMTGLQCAPPEPKNPRVAGLRQFQSADEMRDYLTEQVRRTQRQNIVRHDWGIFPAMGGAMEDSLSGAPSAPSADQEADDGYSSTNIQEAGVDESDIIKNDGSTIYMLSGDRVHVVRANPVAELAEVATLEVPSQGHSLYLSGSKLIVLSTQYQWYGPAGDVPNGSPPSAGGETMPGSPGMGEGPMPMAQAVSDPRMVGMVGGMWNDGGQVTVTIYDVSDPADPTLAATVRLEGQLASSRLIDQRMVLVLNTTPQLPVEPTSTQLDQMTLDQWLPDFDRIGPDGVYDSGNAVDWQQSFRPESPNGYGITFAVSLDVENPQAELQTTAVAATAGVIYASRESLYITDTQYNFDWFESNSDTIIHKLLFTETGTEYVASGIVPGRPLNQYSLGEHEGYLRIATTVEDFTPTGPSNAVYVLSQEESSLAVVGQIEEIAAGEIIYAARFIGDRGFLVTFKRVDPLFTLDLSDPTAPRIVGELKVPGYSDHIQLIDENHLLTIGKDAVDDGQFAWIQGVQLSLFDISDMENPKLLTIDDEPAKVIIGGRGTHSEANANPKAFNWWGARNLLAFPIDVYAGPTQGWQYGQHEFTGLYVYRVTVENGFEFLGRIATSEGETDDGCFMGYFGTTRGVFINDQVYSVSGHGVKAAAVDAVDTLAAEIEFADAEPLEQDCFWGMPEVVLPMGEGLR